MAACRLPRSARHLDGLGTCLRSRRPGKFIAALLACGSCCLWAAAPPAAATPRGTAHRVKGTTGKDPQLPGTIEPQVCASCTPPLLDSGGPVMATNGAAGLTVTPIWWQPSGGRYRFPSVYEDLLDQYVHDIATASGSTDNIYSILTEYYDVVGGVKTYVSYKIAAGTPLVDTDDFPSNGCRPAPGYFACITDAQIRAELKAITASQKLPATLAYFYPVFLPPGVETEDVDGSNSASAYCGYHRAFGSGSDQTVYGDLPYPPSNGGCDTGQAPNGNLRADGEVSTFAHELAEAVTDPLNPQYAWFDGKGNEIADMCDENYGGALGSTSASNPGVTKYNQVISGHKYYVQELFSNLAYHKSGVGQGCALSEALAENPKAAGTGTGATTIGYAFTDAFPTTLPANGKATSSIVVAVGDSHGYVVEGDHVHFSTGLEYGTGLCGKLSSHEAVTDANGHATVTYTASKFNGVCWVLATEADGGRGSESIIYQGTAVKSSPSLVAEFPARLYPGRSATFTMTATNPSSHPLTDAQVDFVIYPGSSTKKSVDARQVRLSYSTHGARGHFSNVALSGSTSAGNDITGYLGSAEGGTMAPHSSEKITFQVTLARNVATSKTVPLLDFEGYLQQINSAAGGGATVGDTLASDITVR
jgi:Phosphate-induced protein 1 conserved region